MQTFTICIRNIVYFRIQMIELISCCCSCTSPPPAYAFWKLEQWNPVFLHQIPAPGQGLHPDPHLLQGPVCPSAAYNLASVAAKVVLPTPPFPVTAIFILCHPPFITFLRSQRIRFRMLFSFLRFFRSSDQLISQYLFLLYKQLLPIFLFLL